MQDEQLHNLLHDWSNDRLPDDETREKILRGVLERPRSVARYAPTGTLYIAAALSGIAAIAVAFLFMATPILPPEPITEITIVQNDEAEKVQVSLIVLKRLPDSDTAVEFLEDTIFVAEKQQLHELELDGHQLFLWIYPLEEELFCVDIGIDKAAETGIVAVPDRPQKLQFQSNGDCFDVFVSVLPFT